MVITAVPMKFDMMELNNNNTNNSK